MNADALLLTIPALLAQHPGLTLAEILTHLPGLLVARRQRATTVHAADLRDWLRGQTWCYMGADGLYRLRRPSLAEIPARARLLYRAGVSLLRIAEHLRLDPARTALVLR